MDGRTIAGQRVQVWDGWIRLVHWSVVALIGLSWWSGETGNTRSPLRYPAMRC